MDEALYKEIFRRKSFHLFRGIGNEKITDNEIDTINKMISNLTPLVSDIKVKIMITKDGASCHRGQEYCILFYSETKENYLQNIGYLGEQLDLLLVSMNIGTLWFGIGKPKEEMIDGLSYVIMMAIAKVDDSDKFRHDMYKSKRKPLSEVLVSKSNDYQEIIDVARFAPSACNSQPWLVEASAKEIVVSRYSKEGKRGIMPKNKVAFYNQIDIGIFLCFLELCFKNKGIKYKRTLFTELDHNLEKNKTAVYLID